MRSFLVILFICSSVVTCAQEMDNYSSVHDVAGYNFVRISYDNDLFAGTDRYYTQGIGIDYYNRKLESGPFNLLLPGISSAHLSKYGIQFRTHGCTPTSIVSDSVLMGDRPFAGVFSFGIVHISFRPEPKLRLTTQFELGLIGPAALGEQIQTGIHRLTNNDEPLGWKHQIKNAPIVNYTARIEKRLDLSFPDYFDSQVHLQAKAGTFQTNLSGGFEFRIGQIFDIFMANPQRFQFYGYSQSSITLVGYDASLMGGITNRDGYHLSYSELNPLVFRQRVGIVSAWKKFAIGLEYTFCTEEIKTGLPHSWAGVRLTFYPPARPNGRR